MSFKLAIYVEANGIDILREKPAEERFDNCLKKLQIEKVYLEIFRGHEGQMRFSEKFLEIKDVEGLKNHYEQQGIETAGGLCIGTWSEGFGKQAVNTDGDPTNLPCYSAEQTKEFYRKVSSRAANIFNEVLIDDWLFADCFCQECIDLFNSQFGYTVDLTDLNKAIAEENEKIVTDWMKFRCQLINDFSQDIVRCAKETNPEVKMNWKLPEWNNRFYFQGIDLCKIRDIYDAFYIGTEAREGVERYAAFHSFRYLRSVMGKKAVGVWFDILNGWDWSLPISVERYINQLKMSVLSGAKEIILWCYPEIIKNGREAHLEKFVEALPRLKKLSEKIAGHIGIATQRRCSIKALHSPEGYLLDHLGTMGIPIKPVSKEEQGWTKIQMVTIHSADLDYREFLQRGGRIVITSEAAQRMVSQGKTEILGLSPRNPICVGTVMVDQFVACDGRNFTTGTGHEINLLVPVGPIFCPDTAEPILMVKDKDQTYPVILRNKYSRGEVLIYCLTKFPLYLHTFYPEITRQILRDYLGEVIGVKVSCADKLETLPPVGLFPMENTIVLVNYNPYPIKLSLWVKPELLKKKIDFDRSGKETAFPKEGWFQEEILLQSEEIKDFPIDRGGKK